MRQRTRTEDEWQELFHYCIKRALRATSDEMREKWRNMLLDHWPHLVMGAFYQEATP